MAKSQSAKLRACKIKLILFDVDGVLTDGKLFFVPAPPGLQTSTQQHAAQHGGEGGFGISSSSMIEIKGFHAHDGTAISLARLAGIKTGLITKRISGDGGASRPLNRSRTNYAPRISVVNGNRERIETV